MEPVELTHDGNESIPTNNSTYRTVAIFIGLLVGWAFLGFVIPFHWILMVFFDQSLTRKATKRSILWHLLEHFVAVALLAFGGTWSRGKGNYTECSESGQVTMDRECMLETQTTEYSIIYVSHFVGLTWMVVQWIFDFINLWGWAKELTLKRPLSLFGSNTPYTSSFNSWSILIQTIVVTFTWLFVVNWSTKPTLSGSGFTSTTTLLEIVIAECIVMNAISLIYLRSKKPVISVPHFESVQEDAMYEHEVAENTHVV